MNESDRAIKWGNLLKMCERLFNHYTDSRKSLSFIYRLVIDFLLLISASLHDFK